MIPRTAIIADEALKEAEAICQTLREDDDGVRRDVLAHAGSRWALGILHALGVYGTLRHAELKRQLSGVTPAHAHQDAARTGTRWSAAAARNR
jgi:hypothetical protein